MPQSTRKNTNLYVEIGITGQELDNQWKSVVKTDMNNIFIELYFYLARVLFVFERHGLKRNRQYFFTIFYTGEEVNQCWTVRTALTC